MYNKKIICVTGGDGSGKSTLIDSIAQSMASVHVAHIWDALDDHPDMLFRSKKNIDQYLCSLTPNARLLFLAHALKYSTDKAIGTQADAILINSYYYKYFATELALGADMMLIKELITHFPKPDITIFLTLSPETAAERKSRFSSYECGISANNDAAAFTRFQMQALDCWSIFDKSGFHELDASLAADVVLQQTLSIIHPE